MIDKSFLICPLSYTLLKSGEKYAQAGLKRLAPTLSSLKDLPYSAEQLRIEASKHADKLSIQGVQTKISARLNIKNSSFEICDTGGNYILKTPSAQYAELPENEDLSMRLAHTIIEVPLHGLLYNADGSLTYFIKRFDRLAKGKKLAVEDFCQLANLQRNTKYEFSMEKLIPLIDKYCSFPAIEKKKLFIRVIFNYLIGNEDMHLKNFSVITRDDKIELSPGYDFVNTSLAIGHAKEQIALPLNGKKNNLSRKDLIDYYGIMKLGLNTAIVQEVLQQFSRAIPHWQSLINISFLSAQSKQAYLKLLNARSDILNLS